jgi:hypothetical protein
MNTREFAPTFEMLPSSPVLHLPDADEPGPDVSIVVPAMDEEITIGEFVEWCHEGLRSAGVAGEILIVDSSDDATPQIALTGGARVLRVPKRGLGHAYRDAISFIRGRFVIMGDADCTYDFREIRPFLAALEGGADFVMGSRFRGGIERGAMPLHHRYFGSPVTTLLLDVLLRERFTDIHCGMRGMSLDALHRMDLRSDGWEYASEMIVRANHLGLQTTEVPIRFLKDRKGRESHVKRLGWLTPFRAGWQTLRVLFVGAANALLTPPGLVLGVLGTIGTLALSTGPIELGSITLTLHTQFLCVAAATTGWLACSVGSIARAIYDPTGSRVQMLAERASFDRIALACGLLWLVGFALDVAFLVAFANHSFTVTPAMELLSHAAVLGIALFLNGFVLFTWMLVVHALAEAQRR